MPDPFDPQVLTGIDGLFGAIFVIALKDMARRRSIEKSLRRARCRSYELIEAVDGNDLDLGELESASKLAWSDYHNRALLPGEVGCYLSHVKVWELIRETGVETALICEDDIVFSAEAATLFPAFMAEMPADWDIIHFHSHRRHAAGESRRRRIGRHILRGWNESYGTLCYAVTARCAGFFLENAFPIRYPVDGLTNWPTSDWCRGYTGYVVDPFPCSPGPFPSQVGEDAARRTQPISNEPIQ